MDIAKLIVGVLSIAVGLLLAGQLAPATIAMASLAIEAQKSHQGFSLGAWNRKL